MDFGEIMLIHKNSYKLFYRQLFTVYHILAKNVTLS